MGSGSYISKTNESGWWKEIIKSKENGTALNLCKVRVRDEAANKTSPHAAKLNFIRQVTSIHYTFKTANASEEPLRAGDSSGGKPRLTLLIVPREAETQGDGICITSRLISSSGLAQRSFHSRVD